ncbi:PREDICTED: ferric reduction oxidase 7, chloroplastic-like [Fragaria vesca subsp. vesca]
MAVEDLHSALISNGNGVHAKQSEQKSFLASVARWVLKSAMWVIFVAWILLFFIVPTDFGSSFYDDWVAATDGTLFGETGSVLLLYSAPIIAIAFLAVPYIIFFGEDEEEYQEYAKFSLWTFPVLVDGPLGVVSAAEMIGIILFIVFVLSALYFYTVANYGMLGDYGDLTEGEKKTFMLQMSAYCFGLIVLSCLAFLFLPIARGSILLRLIDIPFEHATRYHVWLGNLIFFLVTMHGLCYMIVWMIRGIIPSEVIEWKSDGGANLAGIICYGFFVLIWVTTLPPVRKRYFELFFYTHQLYVFFVIFLALHIGGVNFSKAAGGIFLFMLDRFLRFCQSRRTVNIVSATCFPCGTVKLVLPKPANLHYNALGFIFLQVKNISLLQWHPFSVSSSPLDGKYHLEVLIKTVGEWTTKLRETVSKNSAEDSDIQLPHAPYQIMASVEGPYGHESPYYLRYEKLVLVAGGSGISPFLAILSDILHRIKTNKPCLPQHVVLVWAIKTSNELSLLSTVNMGSMDFSDRLHIEIQAYVTRESECSVEDGRFYNAPISSVFSVSKGGTMSILTGTGNKIWAGTYVIASTVGFVFALGLLDILYIDPYSIDAWWYLGLLDVICMVASVLIFGGLTIGLWHLWERKTTSQESAENGNNEIVQSNGTLTDKNEYQKTLISEATVRYGRRPNFSEIFGSLAEYSAQVDVGVFVCGPSTLQSSVAKECRSHNLGRRGRKGNSPIFHYNSHSFDL